MDDTWVKVLVVVNTLAVIVAIALRVIASAKWRLRINELESELLNAIAISKAHGQITEGQQRETAKILDVVTEKVEETKQVAQETKHVAEVVKEVAEVVTDSVRKINGNVPTDAPHSNGGDAKP